MFEKFIKFILINFFVCFNSVDDIKFWNVNKFLYVCLIFINIVCINKLELIDCYF